MFTGLCFFCCLGQYLKKTSFKKKKVWSRKELDTTEWLNWTEVTCKYLIYIKILTASKKKSAVISSFTTDGCLVNKDND